MFMRSRFLFALLAALVCSTCAQSQQHTLTILHTNDMHAKFIPHQAFWVKSDPKPMVGGFNELAYVVDSIRAATSATLLLDAGDVMTGNPISDMEYKGAQGGALFEMMSRIGYDASSPGNHDLDISQENLRGLVQIATFPSLSANLVNDEGKFSLGNRDYTIIERGGLKIGIFGLMLQNLAGMVNQNNIVGVKVLSPIETARRIIAELEPKTDCIIALTHQGVDDDSTLAEGVTGLDVIIGGHSHSRLKRPRVVNNVVIAQAGVDCENLGVLDLTIENKRVVKHNGQLLQLWAYEGRTTRLSPFIDSLRTEIDKEYSEVIATLKDDWKRGTGETGIGNFVTSAMVEAAGAEVGFTNNHGLRKDLVAGPLTKRDLYEVLPFRNVLATFQISGKDLRSIMMYYLTKKPAVQITGVMCQWRRTDGGDIEIVKLEVNGKPVDDGRMYICATSDFFAGQSEGYIGREIERPVFLHQTVFEAVENAARKTKVITSTIENRFQEIK
jgi:2',3'-cyclic-nucleotide 2'-phosphodiesterase (5'-nucleotidase family)